MGSVIEKVGMMRILYALIVLLCVCTTAAFADDKAAFLEPHGRDVIMGDPKAPVTIVEYSSLSCPHCAHFHNEILPELKKDYIDAGKMRLIGRHFPLNEPALKAAMLTQCLPADRFYKFVEVLFKMQEKWAFTMDYMKNLQTIVSVGGVKPEVFNTCTSDSELEKEILLSRQQAQQVLEIQSTPTFFVNGTKIEGARTVDDFKKVIDEKLKASSGKSPAKEKPKADGEKSSKE